MRVLIIGAGIAGLALARALRQRGITAEVVERATEWQPGGAGLYLTGNAVRALGELGIGSDLAARANAIARQRLLDHRGNPFAAIDVDRVWDGVGGCVAIQRAALHEALREAAADVPVRLGTSVGGLENGGTPQVSFSDASTGSYDLVVGADGVHSTIRSLGAGRSRSQLRRAGVLAVPRRRALCPWSPRVGGYWRKAASRWPLHCPPSSQTEGAAESAFVGSRRASGGAEPAPDRA